MTINPSQLAAQDISTVTDFAMAMTYTRISHGDACPPGTTPYSLIGFFNPATNRVELFCADGGGNKYIKVI